MRAPSRRAARAAGVAVVGVVAVSSAFAAYCMAMPGTSFKGAPHAAKPELERALREHVSGLSVEIGPRRATLGDSLERAARYLEGALPTRAANGAALAPRREALTNAPENPVNVVLDLPGRKPGPWVIVGAHYDTAPGGTPGANDNASGTAAALVLARRLAQSEHALPLRFVFFANEEMPYFRGPAMGSLQHARGCRERGEQVRAMLALETMGYYSDVAGSQHYPAPLKTFYPDTGNFIAFVSDLGSRSLLREVVGRFRRHARIASEGGALPSALPGVGWSDHWAFWEQGYPALMVTDTALFRDPTYHRRSDIAPNLDFGRLALVVEGLQQVIRELARD